MQDETMREIRGHLERAGASIDSARINLVPGVAKDHCCDVGGHINKALALCAPRPIKVGDKVLVRHCTEPVTVRGIDATYAWVTDHNGGSIDVDCGHIVNLDACRLHDSLADAATPGVVQRIRKRVEATAVNSESYRLSGLRGVLAIIDEEAAKHD